MLCRATARHLVSLPGPSPRGWCGNKHPHTQTHTHTTMCARAHTHANMHTRKQSARAEGKRGTAHTTTTAANSARRARARYAHVADLARARRAVVRAQARNACLSEWHARQRRVVRRRRAVPRRVAAHIEPPVQRKHHGTDVSSARATARAPEPSSQGAN